MISKTALQEIANASLNIRATHYETEIDDALRNHVSQYGMSGSIGFNADRGQFTLTRDVLDELSNRYRRAGYAVDFVRSDGEDLLRITIG